MKSICRPRDTRITTQVNEMENDLETIRRTSGRQNCENLHREGYQHPEVTDVKVSSPTLSRLGKILTHQWTTFNHAEMECADAKSAFWQGDGQDMHDS